MNVLFSKFSLKKILSIITCIFIAGCNLNPLQGNQPVPSSMNQSQEFSVAIPQEANHKYVRSNESVVYATYEAPTSEYLPSDYSILVYPPESLADITACSKATLCTDPNAPNPDSCGCTMTEPQIIAESGEIFTVTGKFAGYPCPVDHCDDSEYGMNQFKGRYVLYSTKNGKNVKN